MIFVARLFSIPPSSAWQYTYILVFRLTKLDLRCHCLYFLLDHLPKRRLYFTHWAFQYGRYTPLDICSNFWHQPFQNIIILWFLGLDINLHSVNLFTTPSLSKYKQNPNNSDTFIMNLENITIFNWRMLLFIMPCFVNVVIWNLTIMMHHFRIQQHCERNGWYQVRLCIMTSKKKLNQVSTLYND